MGKETRTRADRTREAILAAGETLFLKHGFVGTSMDEVSEASGVSKQTVYAHLQSKEALFLAVVDRMTGRAGDELGLRLADQAADLTVEEFLLTFAREQLDIVLSPRLMQLRRMVIGEAGRFPDLGRLLHERGPARSINRLAAAFLRYSKMGKLQIVDVHQAASLFNWSIPDDTRKSRHASECVRVFLSAYAVTPDP
jgi:TetR/AcrR family transcriptional repressor of mexJK operon